MSRAIRITLALALIAVLAFGALVGATETKNACSLEGDDVIQHLERYGAGCDSGEETYIAFPEGQQIDQIGEPPWTPL